MVRIFTAHIEPKHQVATGLRSITAFQQHFPEVAVNGVTRNGSEWTVAPGKELAHKQARVEHIDTMSVIDSHQTFKIIADAGETIALAYDGLQAAEKLIDNVTNLTWTEMGEAAIDLLIGLI